MPVEINEEILQSLEKQGYVSFSSFMRSSPKFAQNRVEPVNRFLTRHGYSRSRFRQEIALCFHFANNLSDIYEYNKNILKGKKFAAPARVETIVWDNTFKSLEELKYKYDLANNIALKKLRKDSDSITLITPLEEDNIPFKNRSTLEEFLNEMGEKIYGTELRKSFVLAFNNIMRHDVDRTKDKCSKDVGILGGTREMESKSVKYMIEGLTKFEADAIAEYAVDMETLEELAEHFPTSKFIKDFKEKKQQSFNDYMGITP